MRSGPLQQPLPLDAGFQNYAWGDRRFIPDLFRFDASGAPFAEAWFGAHPVLPSTLQLGGERQRLDVALGAHANELLGPEVARSFGGLPFLLKVLAADRPLSIQVHPSRAQAELGYSREDARGLPIDAAQRNYRDRNHKPELLVALTPFFALAGFRARAEIAALLQGVPELAQQLPPLDERAEALEALMAAYLHLDPAVRALALSLWLERLQRSSDWSPRDWEYWLLEADAVTRQSGQPDAGLFFFVLLNLVELMPQQGLFLADGVPHAYLRGAGIEVMATSDNVLRCGLTSKHTDPEELMSVVRFEAAPPQVLDPAPTTAARLRTFPTPAAEFQLQTFELAAAEALGAHAARGPEILLVANRDGRMLVSSQGAAALLREGGQACLIPHGVSYAIEPLERTSLVRASVPHV
jgi:mannose-6-phosphate isomerase class I